MKIFYSFLCLLLFTVTGFAQVDLPITFEDSTIDYELQGFDGNTSMIVVDPTDPNNMVAEAFRDAAAQTWAGTTAGNSGLANPIPFTTDATKMTVRVWSPNADTPIRLKVENAADGNISVETEVNTTMAMAWETLEFDFSMEVAGSTALDLANTYDKVSIFFNFGTDGATAGEQTYYFDDITFVPAPPPAVDLPITFENDAPNFYDVSEFGGNVSMIITDPTDPSNKVMQSTREATAGTFAATVIGNSGLANPIPFTEAEKKLSVRVWSPEAGGFIRLKVEDSSSPATFGQVDVVSSVAMDWETIVFDFDGTIDLANSYDKITIFFNFGIPGGTAGEQIYYWDDVQFVPLEQVDLPITFEDDNVDYNLSDFDGNTSMIVTDPTDPTNTVVEAFRDAAAQTWAGTTAGGTGLANPIPFTTEATKMTVRVWSPNADTPIRLKVEDAADGNISVETEVNTTMAMAWETLEFDFSMHVDGTNPLDLANTYDKVSIFFNFGTDGATAGEQTYYFDDILFVVPPLQQVDLPITFEETNVDYNLTDFDGNTSMIVTDPTDPTNTVVEAFRDAGAQTWAGTTAGGTGLANPVPFTTDETKMTVRVWSPNADTPIRLKVEDAADGNISVETEVNTTMAMAWETLEFDFSMEAAGTTALDLANTYDKVSIFFNFGTDGATAGEQTYYFDNILFVTTPLEQVDLPITFEETNIDYDLVGFEGNTSMIVEDPTDPTNMVAEA